MGNHKSGKDLYRKIRRKLQKEKDARNVQHERSGYWGCEYCHCHNPNINIKCFNCHRNRITNRITK